jgi:hypothetical protein
MDSNNSINKKFPIFSKNLTKIKIRPEKVNIKTNKNNKNNNFIEIDKESYSKKYSRVGKSPDIINRKIKPELKIINIAKENKISRNSSKDKIKYQPKKKIGNEIKKPNIINKYNQINKINLDIIIKNSSSTNTKSEYNKTYTNLDNKENSFIKKNSLRNLNPPQIENIKENPKSIQDNKPQVKPTKKKPTKKDISKLLEDENQQEKEEIIKPSNNIKIYDRKHIEKKNKNYIKDIPTDIYISLGPKTDTEKNDLINTNIINENKKNIFTEFDSIDSKEDKGNKINIQNEEGILNNQIKILKELREKLNKRNEEKKLKENNINNKDNNNDKNKLEYKSNELEKIIQQHQKGNKNSIPKPKSNYDDIFKKLSDTNIEESKEWNKNENSINNNLYDKTESNNYNWEREFSFKRDDTGSFGNNESERESISHQNRNSLMSKKSDKKNHIKESSNKLNDESSNRFSFQIKDDLHNSEFNDIDFLK